MLGGVLAAPAQLLSGTTSAKKRDQEGAVEKMVMGGGVTVPPTLRAVLNRVDTQGWGGGG